MAEQPPVDWPDAPCRPTTDSVPEQPGNSSDAGPEALPLTSVWVRARPFAAAFALMLVIVGGLHAWGQVAATHDDPVSTTLAAARDAVLHRLSIFSPSGRASAPVAVVEAATSIVVETPTAADTPTALATPSGASLRLSRLGAFAPAVAPSIASLAPPYQSRPGDAGASPAPGTNPSAATPPTAPQPTAVASFSKPVSGLPSRPPTQAAAPTAGPSAPIGSFSKPVSGLSPRPPARVVAPAAAARSAAPAGSFSKPVSRLPLRPPAQVVAPAAARPPVAAASRAPAAAPASPGPSKPAANTSGWLRPTK